MLELFKSRLNIKLLKFNISKYRGLIAFFTILFFTVLPIPLLINWYTTGSISEMTFNGHVVLITFFALIASIITPLILFNYLNSKNTVDLFHALPIKRNDLFLTNFVSSILIVVIPFTVNFFLGHIIFSQASPSVDASLLVGISNYWYIIVGLIVSMIPILFVIVNTGTISDTIIYSIIIIVAPFLAFGAFQFFSSDFIPGFAGIKLGVLGLLSPIFATFVALSPIEGGYAGGIYASYWCIIGMIMLGSIIVIHNRRRSEKSEVPFVNSWFFPLIVSLFTSILLVFLIAIFSEERSILSVEALIIPTLSALVIFLLLNMIKNRTLRNIRHFLKNFTILTVITILLTITFAKTYGFGYSYHIPNDEDVISITINNDDYSSNIISQLNPKGIVVEDNDGIRRTLAVHQEIIDGLKNKTLDHVPYSNSASYQSFSVTYKLENNRSMRRQFFVKDASMIEMNKIVQLYGVSELAILNDPTNSTSLKVYDSLLANEYSFTGTDLELMINYSADLERIKMNEPQSEEGLIKYILMIDSEKYGFSTVFIDDRFINTLAFLNESLSSETTPTHANYQTLKYSDSEFNMNSMRSQYLSFVNESEATLLPMNFQDVSQLKDSILSYNTNANNETLLVTADGFYGGIILTHK